MNSTNKRLDPGLWNLPSYGKPQEAAPSHRTWKTPPFPHPRFPQLPQSLPATWTLRATAENRTGDAAGLTINQCGQITCYKKRPT